MSAPAGLWLVPAVLVPFLGMLFALMLGGRNAMRVALLTLVLGLGVALGIADALFRSGESLVYVLGGWEPPLDIALRADALMGVMLFVVAVVVCGIGLYALGDFDMPRGAPEARAPLSFWLLLLAVWGSLNLVFVSGDLFTLYVALELLTFAGVPLVCLDGRGETLRAALPAVRAVGLGAVPAGRGAAVWRLRHAGHHAAGRPHPPRAHRLGGGGADDGGVAGQDRTVPAAHLAAAGTCRRARRGQRGAVGGLLATP